MKNEKKKFNFLLPGLIIAVAIFLRLYQLSSVPPSASLDEASIGYNAYSILQTGADEYGTKFPLVLRAYDDWRPALYVYLVIPFVKLLGLNVIAVRLPSVILSILTVVATYFLTKDLFHKLPLAKSYSLIAVILLAISPWHIYISRLGHEANAGLAFFVFGLLFFVKRRIYLASLFFVLSFMSYQAEKVFLPVFILGLLLIFRKEILRMKIKVVLAALFGVIILTPFLMATFSSNGLARFEATSVFKAYEARFQEQAVRLAKAVEEKNYLGQIFYNRRVLGSQIFLEGYISHFNPKWLFGNISEDRHKVPGLGLFYIWEAPLIILGFIFLLRQKLNRKFKLLIILWIIAAPLPAAITTDAPHVMRTYTALPAPQLLGALGLVQLIVWGMRYKVLSSKYYVSKIIISTGFFVIVTLSLAYFYRQYFLVFPKTQSASFQYALSKGITFVLDNEKQYNKIVFSNSDNLYQSYMFFLFYSRYNPKLYQKQGGTISGGYAATHTIAKFMFRPIDFQKEESGALLVGNSSDFPDPIATQKTFANIDNKEVIKIILK